MKQHQIGGTEARSAMLFSALKMDVTLDAEQAFKMWNRPKEVEPGKDQQYFSVL